MTFILETLLPIILIVALCAFVFIMVNGVHIPAGDYYKLPLLPHQKIRRKNRNNCH